MKRGGPLYFQCLNQAFVSPIHLHHLAVQYPSRVFPDRYLLVHLGSVVLLLLERVSEAQRLAQKELREQDARKGRQGRRSFFKDGNIVNDNEEDADHIVKAFQKTSRGRMGGKRKGGRRGGGAKKRK